MVESRETLALPPKPAEALPVAGQLGWEHLEGHLPPERGVQGAVHLPHPTHAEQLEDLVVREGLADHGGPTGRGSGKVKPEADLMTATPKLCRESLF